MPAFASAWRPALCNHQAAIDSRRREASVEDAFLHPVAFCLAWPGLPQPRSPMDHDGVEKSSIALERSEGSRSTRGGPRREGTPPHSSRGRRLVDSTSLGGPVPNACVPGSRAIFARGPRDAVNATLAARRREPGQARLPATLTVRAAAFGSSSGGDVCFVALRARSEAFRFSAAVPTGDRWTPEHPPSLPFWSSGGVRTSVRGGIGGLGIPTFSNVRP